MNMDQARDQLSNPPEGMSVNIISDAPERIDAEITVQDTTMRVAFLVENGKVVRHTY